MTRILAALVGAFSLLLGLSAASAQDTIKIGVIVPFSGQFADPGIQLDSGIKTYMALHGDEVAGKKIEIIRKDVGGIAPDVAKRLAQELIVRDEVDILAGFLLTPNALAAGDVSQQAKKFMVVMNAATSIITTKSDYMARTSLTTPQINEAFGKWAAESGIKNVYTIVTDYGPGHDSEQAFQRGFTAGGGTIIGSDRTPVVNPDFSAYVQRVKDADPEAVYIWVPGGAQPPAIGKALAERGLTPQNTKILGQGELTFDEALESMGDLSIGIITGFHYDWHNDTPANKEFVDAYQKAFNRSPDIYSIGGFDGMHLIYEALKKTGGNTDGQALIDAAKGMAWESPRGPVSIDPETRDIIQTIYIREVKKVDGELVNVVIDKVEKVKDPVKEAMK
jgi:branched-chain amino acid transport system substrate-binding protein